MTRITVFFLFFFILSSFSFAGVFPKEGITVNYRVISFSFPVNTSSGNYIIELAKGTFSREDSFSLHLIKTFPLDNPSVIAEVPFFNCSYTWRVVNTSATGATAGFHHFSTGSIPNADTSMMRLRILQKTEEYKDAYVFLDGNRALYDMDGNPVWYLPAENRFQDEKLELRDMKITPQGTITFLLSDSAYEISYDGAILWKGPNNGTVSGDASEHYHHEFTRLRNGHYMIMGTEFALCKPVAAGDGKPVIYPATTKVKDRKDNYIKIPLGTLIEYDAKGRVVWSWKSSAYFSGSDLFYRLDTRGKPDLAVHENSFFFDEKHHCIFVSCRNIGRIIKVKYPEGAVLNTYGTVYKQGGVIEENKLFCWQHCCRVSQDGYLSVFNNNLCHAASIPTLILMKPSGANRTGLEKVWEYQCTIEGISEEKQTQYQFPIGGNTTELPGNATFACMGGTYSKVFIVNRDKKILWSALPEKWDPVEKKWQILYSYRASIILNKTELGCLIAGPGNTINDH